MLFALLQNNLHSLSSSPICMTAGRSAVLVLQGGICLCHLYAAYVCSKLLLACSSPGIHSAVAKGFSSDLSTLVIRLTGTLRSCRTVAAAKQCPKQQDAIDQHPITAHTTCRGSDIPAGRYICNQQHRQSACLARICSAVMSASGTGFEICLVNICV